MIRRKQPSMNRPVPMSHPTSILKCFALILIVTLVTMRLGCFSDEVFVTPVEDCLFDEVFIAAEDTGKSRAPLLLKGQVLLDWHLSHPAELQAPVLEPVTRALPIPVLLVRLFPEEIFIPPESLRSA